MNTAGLNILRDISWWLKIASQQVQQIEQARQRRERNLREIQELQERDRRDIQEIITRFLESTFPREDENLHKNKHVNWLKEGF